jgi:ATP adenylyltransferase/5',5'''-P-1,P-4-tetraphosphate phosphorylase II
MTTSNLCLVPRHKEKSTLVSAEVGGLSLNSMAFAGLLLCAGEVEKEAVKAVGVKKVLGSVGFEKIEGRSTEEGSFDETEGALAT